MLKTGRDFRYKSQFSYFLGSTLLVEKLGRLVEGCESAFFLEPKISMQSVQHCASRRRTRTLTNDEDRDYNSGAEDFSVNVCDVLIVGGVLMCYVNTPLGHYPLAHVR